MTLTGGTRLGPYEITALIGTGGMGEVYRATDTNLKRQVAIKILPETLAHDTESLARFQREAEVLASLNHPHIAAIYGLERAGNTTALVMELVEGGGIGSCCVPRPSLRGYVTGTGPRVGCPPPEGVGVAYPLAWPERLELTARPWASVRRRALADWWGY